MTDTYTEAEIREAILNVSNILLAENVIAHLPRPKHDFAEGQVICLYDLNHAEYSVIRTTSQPLEGERHLNMQELGPHVKALRDAVDDVDRHPVVYARKLLRDALAEFDAAVGENND